VEKEVMAPVGVWVIGVAIVLSFSLVGWMMDNRAALRRASWEARSKIKNAATTFPLDDGLSHSERLCLHWAQQEFDEESWRYAKGEIEIGELEELVEDTLKAGHARACLIYLPSGVCTCGGLKTKF
jgi:hypothetical protein